MSQAKLYLPQEADNYEKAREWVIEAFCVKYGGATTYDGTGHWQTEEKKIESEPVTVIETVGDIVTSHIRMVAREVLWMTEESAVLFTVDGEKEVLFYEEQFIDA